ncbi:hypothetical protein HCN44_010985 [Aphidius gifuensis]|uniref:DDE Tnp4 domain-containing protein n=1 Tax=Aphidius gifuensis TaxID=684658 RepID=A0A834Y674_APHGI|nr:hypothetical protein HCN44_010985 [Aphidius gifuensis]
MLVDDILSDDNGNDSFYDSEDSDTSVDNDDDNDPPERRVLHQTQNYIELTQLQDIPDVIGSIDGCHIRIRRPIENQRESYFNKKRYSSILLQGVVNIQRMFTDVHIGEPGSMHGARVLRRSPVYEVAQGDPDFFQGFYLLGDSAYPYLPWLVTPFKQNNRD